MKFIHLSDLHIGKRVYDYSMLEDQQYILDKIIKIIDEEKPNGIIIAGDVYDKSVPPAEAVQLFDTFLSQLEGRDLHVFVISGNHDSQERIAFASQIMSKRRVYMSPVFNGKVAPVTLTDGHVEVDVFMLPFIRPVHVKRIYPDEEILTYTHAVQTCIRHMDIKPEKRSILVTHQFVAGGSVCESEDALSVGGSDQVAACVFDQFDYVALGHLHGPQNVTSERIRYCGTPLKYSFSEVRHKKSVTVVELGEKGTLSVREVPLDPKTDMLEIKGEYVSLVSRAFYQGLDTSSYIHITLTDEEDVPDAIGKLRSIYPNIMKLDYDNARTRTNAVITGAAGVEQKTPIDLFSEFYHLQNNSELSDDQRSFVSGLIDEIWGDSK